MSRKEIEREFKRQLIASAALELFLASSYEEVTVQDIASAAEFGKGTLYQYFSSKEEILYYLVCQVMDKAYGDIEEECTPETDARQALNTYMTRQYSLYLTYNRIFLSYLRLKLEGGLNPDWIEGVKIRREQKLEYLAGIISLGQEQGIFIQADSYKLARSLRNIIRGFSLEQLEYRGDKPEPLNDLELIKSVIFGGILQRD